jgi:hypothetical protein
LILKKIQELFYSIYLSNLLESRFCEFIALKKSIKNLYIRKFYLVNILFCGGGGAAAVPDISFPPAGFCRP